MISLRSRMAGCMHSRCMGVGSSNPKVAIAAITLEPSPRPCHPSMLTAAGAPSFGACPTKVGGSFGSGFPAFAALLLLGFLAGASPSAMDNHQCKTAPLKMTDRESDKKTGVIKGASAVINPITGHMACITGLRVCVLWQVQNAMLGRLTLLLKQSIHDCSVIRSTCLLEFIATQSQKPSKSPSCPALSAARCLRALAASFLAVLTSLAFAFLAAILRLRALLGSAGMCFSFSF